MKKLILLIFTLIIPASVFVFLKFFGTNTFEVPYLFENGIPGCLNSDSPHIVSDINFDGTLTQQLNSYRNSEYVVYGVLEVKNNAQLRKIIIQLVRIQDAFYEIDPPYFALLLKGNIADTKEIELLCGSMGLNKSTTGIFYADGTIFYDFLKCEIALIENTTDPVTNFALVDTERKIRSIYNSSETEEVDKLILELKILKQQQ